jgi:hypothetical protein
VLHVDDAPTPDAARECWPDVPRILIGATRSPVRPQNGHADKCHGDHYLEKPFHYGELIRAIERALAAQSA